LTNWIMSLVRTKRTTKEIGWRKAWPALAFIVAFVLLLGTHRAQAATASESEVKAAVLYNFTKFVEWPAEAFASTNSPIRLAIFGDDDFATQLRSLLSDKKAHGRSFEVRTITTPQEARSCQVVFVAGSENRRVPQVLEATRKAPVLTVGESDQFIELGGMINLFFEESQPGFDVNPEPAEKVKLQISSKLLRLAKKRSPK
jgi:hypothetical protein